MFFVKIQPIFLTISPVYNKFAYVPMQVWRQVNVHIDMLIWYYIVH